MEYGLLEQQSGREIAKELKDRYGNALYTMPQDDLNDLIAEKIMERMRNGQLITHPDDKRCYRVDLENNAYYVQNLLFLADKIIKDLKIYKG